MVRVRGIQFDKIISYRKAWTSLFVCMLFCSFLVIACGTPAPPKQTLTSEEMGNNGTPGIGTVTQGAQVLRIQVVNDKTNVTTYPGGQMNMTMTTSPYALCSFIVDYGIGKPSDNVGVVARIADAKGMVSWTWRVDRAARTGAWPLKITAILSNGSKTSTQISVTVTFPPIIVVGSQTNLRASPGGNMQLYIATAPSVGCAVKFSFGPAGRSKSLTQFTNNTGATTFNWHVDAGAAAGVWPIAITVTLADGEKVSNQISMTVL